MIKRRDQKQRTPRLFRFARGRLRRGFTLVEFVVILAIFAIMAGVTLFNFRGFESNVSLTNLAHDIALTIRQAQVYGISATQQLELTGQTLTSQSRGVVFIYDGAAGEFEKKFQIFVDSAPGANADNTFGDGRYNDSDDRILDTLTVKSADRITNILVEKDSGARTNATSDVFITFTRPHPDATILLANERSNISYDKATITIESPSGNQRFIEILGSGQISITQPERQQSN